MAKERVSLTLDSEVLDRVDQALARKGIDNRSRGIEELLKSSLKQQSLTTAVILAGGDEPDALININGRPVLDHILDTLEEGGIDTVYIATGQPDIAAALGDHDLTINTIEEEAPLGTAGGLRRIRDEVDDTVLVINGDILCDVDLTEMKAAHEETGGLATIALTTVRDTSNYGVIRMKRNKVVGFKEKPDESSSHLVNAGIYLVEPALIDRLPDEDTAQRVDLETLFEELAAEGELNGYVHDGTWREVG